MLIIASILFLIIAPFALTGYLFAPWVPISTKELSRLGKLLKLKPTDTFYELGCGDGRVVEYVAKTFKCKSIGVELNPFLFLYCFLVRRAGLYVFGDLFTKDYSDADCVYLFGLPRALNSRVKTKLERELKPKTRIVSYGFQIESWKPVKIDKPDKANLPIFIYELPYSRNLRA